MLTDPLMVRYVHMGILSLVFGIRAKLVTG